MTQARDPIDDDPIDDAASAPTAVSGSGAAPRLIQIAAGALIAVVAVAALAAVLFGGDGDDAAGPGGSADAAVDSESANSGIDQFPFLTEAGNTATLADFAGQPTVVNFYASWCAPCRAELPHFVEVSAQAGDRVQFLGVNHDIDETSWRSLNDEFELNYPTVYQADQEIFTELDLLGMPATTFITADGEVAHTFTGVLNDETLKDLIAEHLGVEV